MPEFNNAVDAERVETAGAVGMFHVERCVSRSEKTACSTWNNLPAIR